MVLKDGHGKVVGVNDGKVAKELLDLEDSLLEVDLRKVLQPQIIDSVGEDCTLPQ